MTIFEAIRKDHEIQRDLLEKLVNTSGDTDRRRELWYQLKKELQIHEDAEERSFYKPLIDKDLTQEKARHSIAEHHEIDEMIEQIEETEFSSTGWLTLAKSLKELVTHHLDEEEQEVFQLAGKALTENQKTSLASNYTKEIAENR